LSRDKLIYAKDALRGMKKGLLVGALIGVLAGLAIQTTSTFSTGMAAQAVSPHGFQLLTTSVGVTMFIAAAFGIVGAFFGALLQDVIERRH
jgi:purine-cytosine permease-like protein